MTGDTREVDGLIAPSCGHLSYERASACSASQAHAGAITHSSSASPRPPVSAFHLHRLVLDGVYRTSAGCRYLMRCNLRSELRKGRCVGSRRQDGSCRAVMLYSAATRASPLAAPLPSASAARCRLLRTCRLRRSRPCMRPTPCRPCRHSRSGGSSSPRRGSK